MPFVLNRVERGRYLDSVALMRLSRRLSALPGIEEASLMIGSPSNKALLREAGLLAAEGEQAGANDLVVPCARRMSAWAGRRCRLHFLLKDRFFTRKACRGPAALPAHWTHCRARTSR